MQIGLAGWSINRRFRRQENPLLLLDFPQLARDEWGFEAVELNSPFFASRDGHYLDALRNRAEEASVALWGMAVDGTGSLCGEDEAERQANVEKCLEWLGVSKHLGLFYTRFNTGGDVEPSDEQIERCADSFRHLSSRGEQIGVRVCIENHGGLSRTPGPIVQVMEAVNSPFCRTLPDFGNFADDIRDDAITQVAPYAAACHAKFWEFDAQGHDTRLDIFQVRQLLESCGFDGRLALEFEGQMDDGQGVRLSKALLERAFGGH